MSIKPQVRKRRTSGILDLNELVTKEDILKSFKGVVDYVKRIESLNVENVKNLKEVIDKTKEELKTQSDESTSESTKRINQELQLLLSRLGERETQILNKLAEVKNGKDADEDDVVERSVERVKKELVIPTTEDILNDVPSLAERIRDSLELLEGDNRLDVSAIKGIEKLLKDIDGNIKKAVGAMHVPSPVGWTKHQSISLSSGTSVYNLDDAPAHNGKAAIVRYEGQVLTETTHYSISGTAITLTFDPNNSTKLDVTYWPF